MTQNEKESLLSFFSLPAKWCKDMEARDASGESVHYDDPAAVAWDLTGGLCYLFGWERAQELFPQFEKHLESTKKTSSLTNVAIASMVALQEFNDRDETTHQSLLEYIQMMPVWSRGPLKNPFAKEMTHVQSD